MASDLDVTEVTCDGARAQLRWLLLVRHRWARSCWGRAAAASCCSSSWCTWRRAGGGGGRRCRWRSRRRRRRRSRRGGRILHLPAAQHGLLHRSPSTFATTTEEGARLRTINNNNDHFHQCWPGSELLDNLTIWPELFQGHPIWQFDNLTIWQFDNLTICQFDNLPICQFNNFDNLTSSFEVYNVLYLHLEGLDIM